MPLIDFLNIAKHWKAYFSELENNFFGQFQQDFHSSTAEMN